MIPEHGFFADFFVQISHFQNVDPDPVEELVQWRAYAMYW